MSKNDGIVSCVTLTGAEYVTMLAEAQQLKKDNERLRAALEWIAGTALTEAEAMAEKARAALEGRSCTCHPSEAPTPCQRKYALDDCIKTALEARDE